MMKILVTGANGLLGANVVRELLRREHEVRVLVRPASDLRGIEGLQVSHVTGDILDAESLDRSARGCDAVIHMAANTSQWPTHYSFYEAVNVTGTKNVINACRNNNVKRVVYVSTANAFGNGTKQDPGTELSEFSGFRYNSGYMISKYVAQQWVLAEVEKHRLPVVTVNPTFMIGPYDTKPGSNRIVLMGLGKRMVACPPGGKNFIHSRDAAIGVCNALTMGTPGECYLLANMNLSYHEFFSMLGIVTGQKPVIARLPRLLVRSAGLGGTLWESATGKPAPLNLVNASLLCLGNYYSGQKAVEALDLPQTPVEQAIEEAVRWFHCDTSRF